MSGPAFGNTSRATHQAVVDLTRMYLGERLDGLTSRPYSRRAADDLDDLGADVRGIPNVYLDVSARIRHDLAGDLDSARRGADIAGAGVAAFIQWRAGTGIENSYAVLSLADFRKLLAGEYPRT